MTEQARITVNPEFALIDVARDIRIDGFPAYAFITVTATMQMCGAPWRSQAVFVAGHDGSLDLGRDSPVSGSYACLLYTSPSPRDLSTSRMPSSA